MARRRGEWAWDPRGAGVAGGRGGERPGWTTRSTSPRSSSRAGSALSDCSELQVLGPRVVYRARHRQPRPRARYSAGVKAGNPTLSSYGTTIFEAMSALAREHAAVNLGQGFPDDRGRLDLRKAAAEYVIEG